MQAVTNSLALPGGLGQRMKDFFPGILVSGTIAIMAVELSKSPWMQAHGISALTLAIVGGMIVGNTLYPRLSGFGARGVTFLR